MSLIFLDGFDHYTTAQLVNKWGQVFGSNAPTIQNAGPAPAFGYGKYLVCPINSRWGASALSGSGPAITLKGAPYSNLIIGFRFQVSSATLPGPYPVGMIVFADSFGQVQGALCYTASGQLAYIQVTGGGALVTTLLTGSGFIQTGSWYYVEIKVIGFTTSPTSTIEIRVNGATAGVAAGVATAQNGNGVSMVQAGGSVFGFTNSAIPSNCFDDLYIFSTTGTSNNDFAGDVKIVPLLPAGLGRVNQWVKTGAATNWQAVNEIPPDGDVSYVSDATVGDIDDYTLTGLSALTPVAGVKAVQANAFTRKDDAPARVLGLGVGNGAVEAFDAGQGLPSSYAYLTRQMDINPLTGLAWTTADFVTLQAAIKVVS